jgi:hypothetical protein
MGAGRNSFSNMAILLNFPYPAKKRVMACFQLFQPPCKPIIYNVIAVSVVVLAKEAVT